MTTEFICLRSEFLNTQVITRNTGRRLGVVREVLVDIDSREVVALGLRDNRFSLSGIPRYMYLNSISQSGDVVLVENEDVIEDIDIDIYNKLINCEVITETGEPLGKVRDFQFNVEDGKVSSIIIASIGLPQIPESFISTYELGIEEIISSGPNRIIVFEGAEDRVTQVSVGLLERLGIGRPPWDKEDEEGYYTQTVAPENQLPTGIPVRTPVKPLERRPVAEDNWDEDSWEEVRVTSAPPPRQRAESLRYEEYDDDYDDYDDEENLEEDNWGEMKEERSRRYDPRPPVETTTPQADYQYNDVNHDVWDDDVESEPYQPPRINIPQKQKQKAPEYEEY